LFLIIFLMGCVTFKPFERPHHTFEPTKPYKVAVDFKKPGVPKMILLDKNFNIIPEDDTTTPVKYIAIPNEEMAKIKALNKLYNAQEDIIKDQADLVNSHIDTINGLKELLGLKEWEIKKYEELWVNSENAYLKEKAYHTWDNFVNRTLIIILGAGCVVLAL